MNKNGKVIELPKNMTKIDGKPNKLTAVTFNLTEKQMEVLKAVMSIPANAGVKGDANEACRIAVVQMLIAAKKEMVAQELSQGV